MEVFRITGRLKKTAMGEDRLVAQVKAALFQVI